nr:aldehyde dehydrogenase family protein [Streptomyces sp. GMY02]
MESPTEAPLHTLALTDPRTGRVRGDLAVAREEQVALVTAEGRRALGGWRALTPRERSRRLERLAALIEEHAEEYGALERAGTGKPASETAGELEQAADLFRFYAWAARTRSAPAAGSLVAGHESWVRWEPIGVVGVVSPGTTRC